MVLRMKPHEMMVHYRDALDSMEKEPDAWLRMFKQKLMDCVNPDAMALLNQGVKRCEKIIARKSRGLKPK